MDSQDHPGQAGRSKTLRGNQTMKKSNHSLNWHPAWANPLDYLFPYTKQSLVSQNGESVIITQSGTDFVVTIGESREITGSNLNTCYYLNMHEVGLA